MSSAPTRRLPLLRLPLRPLPPLPIDPVLLLGRPTDGLEALGLGPLGGLHPLTLGALGRVTLGARRLLDRSPAGLLRLALLPRGPFDRLRRLPLGALGSFALGPRRVLDGALLRRRPPSLPLPVAPSPPPSLRGCCRP